MLKALLLEVCTILLPIEVRKYSQSQYVQFYFGREIMKLFIQRGLNQSKNLING